jgi:excisionase family DNA binding protein
MNQDERSFLWDVEQVARALAISPWTVRSCLRQGKLHPVRVGRRVLFEPAECERFLNACKAPKAGRSANYPLQEPRRRTND